MNTKGFEDFLAANWKILAGVLALALVAAVGWGVMRERRASVERVAANAFFEAQTKARALAAQKKTAEAVASLAEMVKAHGGTRAAYEAQLQMGDLQMDAGQFTEAATHYNAAHEAARDSFSKILARYSLGIAQETAGQVQEAVASYEQALQVQGVDFLRPEILMAAARCYEALNQVGKAAELYKQVQEKFGSRAYYSGAAAAFEKQLTSSEKAQ